MGTNGHNGLTCSSHQSQHAQRTCAAFGGATETHPHTEPSASRHTMSGALEVSFRINGHIAFTGIATGSKYSWKLPPKDTSMQIRIPRKSVQKTVPSRKDPSPSRGIRDPSPTSRRPSSRGLEDDDISEAGFTSDASSDHDISDGDSLDSFAQGSKKRQKKEMMTARQRSIHDGGEMAQLVSIQDRKKPEKVLTEDQLKKKRLQAKKRKIEQEKAAEKTKQETINKILNAKGDKHRREVKQKNNKEALRRTKALEVPHVRWASGSTANFETSCLSFSKNVDFVPILFRSLFNNPAEQAV